MPSDDRPVKVPREDWNRLLAFLDTAKGQRIELKPEAPWRQAMGDFLEVYSECGHVGVAAELVGVPRTTLYNWRKGNATFDERWSEIKERILQDPNKDRLLVDYVKKLRAKLENSSRRETTDS